MVGEPEDPMQREIVLTRFLEAPRNRVFQLWTQHELLAEWWGPAGFSNPRCQLEPKVDGMIRIDMQAPDGKIYPCFGTIREIVPPERLVFTCGSGTGPSDLRFDVLCSLTLVEQPQGKTLLTLQLRVLDIADPASASDLDQMETGWRQSLDRLAERLAVLT